ncbi:TusE/DsrC/DsvC family sulfur relay protein [Marinobacterium marinum]|uniref:Sulfurtransferase n=1 Tax=Marinobacterium marinum TaxID=2756129 RepID=A0A7W1WXW9_9GAMM|nr:TusE/DsrC/DsvC family sulfur relay protein [Marinobacterium marinum]MBA4502269.1 TusE/DsrC/DsvC family sulfur relay protein [Marinobacterium marinum]
MELIVNGHAIALDEEGYLYDLHAWTPAVAEHLAHEEGLELTDAHWEIIYLLRDFYQDYQLSPAMRPLTKAVATKLGQDKGRSIYLMKLFPGSPAKRIARLAGLPKPDNCL